VLRLRRPHRLIHTVRGQPGPDTGWSRILRGVRRFAAC